MKGDCPLFSRTYHLETLSLDHMEFLQKISFDIVPLNIKEPPSPMPDKERRMLLQIKREKGLWLIIHEGPEKETIDLIDYAKQVARNECITPNFIVAGLKRPEELPRDIQFVNVYPVYPLFGIADRIVTSCSFHAISQAFKFRHKHICKPFKRKFDDQYLRAEEYRTYDL